MKRLPVKKPGFKKTRLRKIPKKSGTVLFLRSSGISNTKEFLETGREIGQQTLTRCQKLGF